MEIDQESITVDFVKVMEKIMLREIFLGIKSERSKSGNSS